jgi:radical SAM protein with 4Fe4S-binding SPASM domain
VLRVLAPFVEAVRREHPAIAGMTLFPVGVGPEGSQKPGVALTSLLPDELRELAFAVALLYRAGFDIGIGAYPMVNPLLSALGYPESRMYRCNAGRGRVCVHADRSVSSCHPVKDAIYGAWRPGLLRELAGFPVHDALARRDFDGCRSCEHNEACGHCRAFVTASGASLLGNDEVCREVVFRQAPSGRRVVLPVIG